MTAYVNLLEMLRTRADVAPHAPLTLVGSSVDEQDIFESMRLSNRPSSKPASNNTLALTDLPARLCRANAVGSLSVSVTAVEALEHMLARHTDAPQRTLTALPAPAEAPAGRRGTGRSHESSPCGLRAATSVTTSVQEPSWRGLDTRHRHGDL